MKFLLIPFIYFTSIWTEAQEKRVLKNGRELSPHEKEISEKLRIKRVDDIRILSVSKISYPLFSVFKILSKYTKSLISTPIGLTLGYAILLDKRYENELHLIAHELVHVKQYEEMGGHSPFLKSYIFQCLKYGYRNCQLEIEADELSSSILNCGSI